MDHREKLKTIINGLISEARGRAADLTDSTSLFRSGLLDSIAVVKLSNILEQDFGVDFEKVRFDVSKIDSINAILKLIPAKIDDSFRS